MKQLKEGQKLWFVGCTMSNHRKERGEVTVTKVGRKWADITGTLNGRIDVETFAVDGKGYPSPGKCYESEDAWKEKEEADTLWRDLHIALGRTRPVDVSREKILEAASLLGANLPGAPSV